jgi:predicted RNase H-like HicB family nuclease
LPAWSKTSDCQFKSSGARFSGEYARYNLVVEYNDSNATQSWSWVAICDTWPGETSRHGNATTIIEAMAAAEEALRSPNFKDAR